MAIKNTKLGGADFSTPTARVKPTDLNDTNNAMFEFVKQANIGVALGLIRQLQDRSITFSAGSFDWWGDAYTDSSGRMDSVNTTRSVTTAQFSTNKYIPGISNQSGSGTLNDPDSFTSPTNAFDDDDTTSATKSGLTGAQTLELGKTFTSRRIDYAFVSIAGASSGGGSNGTSSLYLETYNGSVWTTTGGTLATQTSSGSRSVSFTGWVAINQSACQGVRAVHNCTNGSAASVSATFTTINFGEMSSTEIKSAIPQDTFSSTISTAILVPHIANWESGADINYKLTYLADNPTVFVIISATSISAVSDFAINNCLIKRFSTGKWILYCTTGTDAVKRAQIYKTLFYGSDGSNPRASSTYITGITALKTNTARDVGKRAYLAKASCLANVAGTYTGTFADTTTNTSCSSWSNVVGNGGVCVPQWENPTATVLNSSAGSGNDETGIDLTADEKNNPATCRINLTDLGSYATDSASATVIVISTGAISWAAGGSLASSSNLDFFTTNSIPLFTATTETVTTQDTGWLACGSTPTLSIFTAFTEQPDTCVVKLIPKSSSPTIGYPSVYGFAVRAY